MVGDDDVRACALHARERLEDDAFLVDPAVRRGRLDHRVFAADVVGRDGEIDAVAHLAHDVEVGERRLDHDDVRALGDVEVDLLEGLAAVRGIHLVLAAIAELRRAVGGVAEGAVVAGGVFDGVAHDGGVLEALFIERGADGGDAAVHHVGGRDDVGARLRLRDGDFLQEGERLVVVDVVPFEVAAVTVRRVLAETDVADDHELRHSLLDGGLGTLHGARHVPGGAAVCVLVLRQAEDLDGGDAERGELLRELDGVVDGEMVAAGHARDLLADVRARHDEDRIDEVLDGERRLLYHRAHGGRDAHAARTKFLFKHGDASFL